MISSDEHYLWEERFDSYRGYQNISALRLSENIADYFNGVVLQRLSGYTNNTDGKMKLQVIELMPNVHQYLLMSLITSILLSLFIACVQCLNRMALGVYCIMSWHKIPREHYDWTMFGLLSWSCCCLHQIFNPAEF